ncbi:MULTISPECIES: extracellular solute-binding protein [unclassified Paenibacillus]|uniref:extracellular solute-binding protein n=1 Tax=unclassified Paenibacillus TaxID=185978 RepID=UPI00363E63C1
MKKWVALCSAIIMAAGVVTGCGLDKPASTGETKGASKVDDTPLQLSMALQQVGEIPSKGNEFEQELEKYTNTKLDIQWIPNAAYDEKINVMIASNELPKLVRLNYVPTTINAMQSGLFWEIGPMLKDYKNLAALDKQYFENVSVEGKIYGVPVLRPIGRAAIVYRKDWFDKLGLKIPKTLDDWYKVMKAIATEDPDGNNKADTYGTQLYKRYNEGTQPPLTRIAVTQGAPNRWAAENGKFTPEFMTKPYVDTMKLFRKLYEENLINQDFAVYDLTEHDKAIDSERVGIKLGGVATNGRSFQDRMAKVNPKGVFDMAFFEGPNGIRQTGEPGNFGVMVIPKSSVKTEAELKRVLTFLDQLLDSKMATLQRRGIDGKHYKVSADGKNTEITDLNLFNKEIKPYRDNLISLETLNVLPQIDSPIGVKGNQMEGEGTQYSVPNPALTLNSAIYSERGKELDQMIWDAQTKYIMGRLDDAGWKDEVEKWRKAGGDQLIKEYEQAYAKMKK